MNNTINSLWESGEVWTVRIKNTCRPCGSAALTTVQIVLLLMFKEGCQHPLSPFYCKSPSVGEKKKIKRRKGGEEGRNREEGRNTEEGRGEKTDGDRWANRQVRKDTREEGAERRRRGEEMKG